MGAPEPSLEDATAALAELVAVMRRLREPDADVRWARERTYPEIAVRTIEEAYEVADAAERHDVLALRDELGDLALHVVFYSAIATDAGQFTLADVLSGSVDKMRRRHAHAFGDAPRGAGWEIIKARERLEKSADPSILADLPRSLPALLRADKLGRRAASVGFDWPDAAGARAKVDEELAEVDAAEGRDERLEEVGDLLLAVANLARHLEVEPEAALRAANAKFERRFRAMEAAAGESFAALSLDDKEALWAEAKRA